MPLAKRSTTIAAEPAEVWRTVSDPHHLPRWWPKVTRVEGVAGDGFTEVLQTDKGASVRADFRIVDRRAPELIRWVQEIEGTPFERILVAADTELRLAAVAGGTRVEVRLRQKLRGLARLGGFMVRRATAKQLDDALARLGALHGA